MTRGWFRMQGALLALAMMVLAAAPPAAAPAPDRIDINTAGVEALVTLPGIGKSYAERIIAHREKHGPFKKVEDLLEVPGIGEKTFQKIRDRLTVGKQG